MSKPSSREEALFFAALEAGSVEERAAFLERECAGNAALRAAVEALLRANEKAEAGFLDELPQGSMMEPSATMMSERTVLVDMAAPVAGAAHVSLPAESYTVGDEIARGGMGSILEAEDRKLGRKVAMKVMRLRADASEDEKRRFIREGMTGFDLDGDPHGGHYTGLITVNGKQPKDTPDALHGKQVQDSDQHELEVTVRLDGANAKIATTLDGQPLYQWTGPTATLAQHERWITPPGALAADWVVYEVKAKRMTNDE